jgi:hypothetical protein
MSSWIFTKVKNGAKPMASGPALLRERVGGGGGGGHVVAGG